MKKISRFKFIMSLTWALSVFALIVGFVITREQNISPSLQVFASLLIEGGGAFFFAITVGWLIDRLRDAEGYSVL